MTLLDNTFGRTDGNTKEKTIMGKTAIDKFVDRSLELDDTPLQPDTPVR